jgi:hypothetical protein
MSGGQVVRWSSFFPFKKCQDDVAQSAGLQAGVSLQTGRLRYNHSY